MRASLVAAGMAVRALGPDGVSCVVGVKAAPDAWPLPKRTPYVLVEWLDSSSLHGWHDRNDALTSVGSQALPCRTVGYLWKRNKHRLLLVQSQSAGKQVGEPLAIPVGAVVRVRTLVAAGDV